jgi:tetratricopeptide (TPR) repeat protein
MSRSAYMEARDRLNSALELLHVQPDEPERDRTEISLRFSLNICMKFSGGLGTAASVENMERARQLCERVGDDTSLFEALNALEDQYFQSAENQKIQAVGEELLKIATRTNNSEMLGRALFWLGAFSGMRGEFTAAAEALEQARSLSAGGWSMRDSQGWDDWRIAARTFAALVWWTLGFPERAMAKSAESFEVARAVAASPSVLMIALFWSSFLNLRCRDWKTAVSQIDEAGRLVRKHGMLDPTGFFRGWAVARLGQPEDGLAKMLPARGWMTALRRWRLLFFWGLADVYMALGDARQGLEAVGHALQVSRGEFEAELRRLKGELLLIGDEAAVGEATQCFREAIELARRQSAKSWELRATMSLARLLAKQGRHDEAYSMLSEIYGWFTEGFDTADLKDAKALLDELSA